ncbi:glycoside hydrolase [Gelidibacter gilvus]|uniref:Glycoside hydrolase n=2 Tax=Gelidibacter maritimus TaxID=2761487 RepID=A0A7W2M6B1_9FLAO|nr:glycoside hydrolase TIM-barrel-like domain-containing protein [Gelidibacter maritimus]MBA6153511.1 glycoside hydrolase [Gelidibacter maritimus]
MIFRILCFVSLCFMLSCSATVERQEKINGVSYVASRDSIGQHHIEPVVNLGANYAAIMPFDFVKDLAHPEISFNTGRQWFGETEEGVKQYINLLHNSDIQVMLKPQIWVWRGEFTGFIKMTHEADWKLLENSYSDFILAYAKVAQEANVDIFCIGTELENFIDERPSYWKELIIEVKKIYKGKLTYAANWNEYERTPFWDDLDFIGIDAYFPVDAKQSPTISGAKKGWQVHKAAIKNYAMKHKKQILFTEFGYRSIDFAGRAPWTVDRVEKQVNLEAQAILTQALLEEFWHENWFAGGFVWKWFHKHNAVGGKDDNRFTPQNKPAEEVIRTFYKKYSL